MNHVKREKLWILPQISIAILAFSINVVSAQGVPESIEAQVSKMGQTQHQISAHKMLLVSIQEKLNTTSTKISELKRSHRQTPSIFKQYRLESLLKEAQSLANQAMGLNKQQLDLQEQLNTGNQKLIEKLDQNITFEQSIVKNRMLDVAERQAAYVAMMAHVNLRDQFLSSSVSSSEVKAPLPIKIARSKDSVDQRDVLTMLKKDIKSEVTLLTAQLNSVQKQNFIRSELENFLDEEAFFSETGFVRTAATQKNIKENKNTGTADTATTSPTVAANSAQDNRVTTDASSVTTPLVGTKPNTQDANTSSVTASSMNVPAQAIVSAPLPTKEPTVSRTHVQTNTFMSTSTSKLSPSSIEVSPKLNHQASALATPSAPLESKNGSEKRDRIGTVSQDLLRAAQKKKTHSHVVSGAGQEANRKAIQDRLQYLKNFLRELDSEEERLFSKSNSAK